MKIPNSFRLAGRLVLVKLRRSIGRGAWGRMWLDQDVMELASHHKGRARPTEGPHGVAQTFWHEMTHAILYSMGNPLYKDEAFVNAFALLLAQAVETAEFDDGKA